MNGNLVDVRFAKRTAGITASWVQGIVASTLRLEGHPKTYVGVFLTSDTEIRRINKRHLGHDWATDVISFGFGGKKSRRPGPDLLGDIVVSIDTAKRTAKELSIPFKEELARYLVHGTLHLLGYDDKKTGDRKRMHGRQETILKKACAGR